MPYHTSPHFPNLTETNYRITSPINPSYNCVAWAAGDDTKWWWPDPFNPFVYWPEGIELRPTMAAFVAVFEQLGFSTCDASDLEPGFEKIAIFRSHKSGAPGHVAKQLPNGVWASKLGEDHDIEHPNIYAVGDGYDYGVPEIFMRRAHKS